MTIFACCASTTLCVRVARDCNIAVNAINIRRQYHRNEQLVNLMREKANIERNARRAAAGIESSEESIETGSSSSPVSSGNTS